MQKASRPWGSWMLRVLTPLVAAGLLVTATPGDAAAATAQEACPSTISVNGQTAHLSSAICADAELSVGIPVNPVLSIGVFDIGHCTGCECGYTYSSEAGSRFTRRAASECGWGSAGGGGSSGGSGDADGPKLDDDSCQWGRDYLGWGHRGAC